VHPRPIVSLFDFINSDKEPLKPPLHPIACHKRDGTGNDQERLVDLVGRQVELIAIASVSGSHAITAFVRGNSP